MEKNKVQPATKQLEEVINKTPEGIIRAENSNEESGYLGDLYGKAIKQIGEVDPEIQKATFFADFNLHEKYIEKRNKRESDLEEKKARLKSAQKEIIEREESINQLQNKINTGGILPVEKDNLLKQLDTLKKIQEIRKSDASLTSSEIDNIKNKDYKKPKGPGEDIIKN